MNPFQLKMKNCNVQREGSQWVSAEELDRAAFVTTLEQGARQRIAKVIKKARKQRDAAQQRANEITVKAHQEAASLMEQWQQEAYDKAIERAVKWHLDEAQLTRAVVDTLEANIAEKIKTVLTAWTLEQELSSFLIKRLTAQVCDRVGHEAVTLKVSAQDYQAIEKAFDGQLNVEVSSVLSSGQAELSSTCLTAKLDLAEHLQLLLDTFVGELSPHEVEA